MTSVVPACTGSLRKVAGEPVKRTAPAAARNTVTCTRPASAGLPEDDPLSCDTPTGTSTRREVEGPARSEPAVTATPAAPEWSGATADPCVTPGTRHARLAGAEPAARRSFGENTLRMKSVGSAPVVPRGRS